MKSPLAQAAGNLVAAAISTGIAAGAWGTLVERHQYTLRRWTIPVLPIGSTPLRILHLSDMHLVPRQTRRSKWVQNLTALEPDLVINTGDNLSHPEAIPAALTALQPLMRYPGAFVFGSNDYFYPQLKNPFTYFNNRKPDIARLAENSFDIAQLRDGLQNGGWLDLTHQRHLISLGPHHSPVELSGVDDPHLEYDNYQTIAGPAAQTTGDARISLGVVHAPYTRVLDSFAGDGYGAIIAGHTHGGQVCWPGGRPLVTNCDLDVHRAAGLSRWWPGASGINSLTQPGPHSPAAGNTSKSTRMKTALPDSYAPENAPWMHVSAGIGHSRYAPIRLFCRPEASLLTLVSKEH